MRGHRFEIVHRGQVGDRLAVSAIAVHPGDDVAGAVDLDMIGPRGTGEMSDQRRTFGLRTEGSRHESDVSPLFDEAFRVGCDKGTRLGHRTDLTTGCRPDDDGIGRPVRLRRVLDRNEK